MQDPYKVRIAEGKMLGRGVVDMKGALACMMVAMAALKRSGETLGGDLIFAGVIDEEDSSLGTKALLEQGLKADAAIVGEPTEMEVCIGHRGVEWFEVQFQGKAVHGGRPKDGVNAILKAAEFISRVERDLAPKLERRIHPVIGESTLNFGVIKGGTQPSTVAGECTLQISRRWIPSESYESVVSDFEQILNELRAEDPQFKAVFRPMEESCVNQEADQTESHHEALETQAAHPVVTSALNAIRAVSGKENEPAAFDAWSDGGILSACGGIPSIVLGPGSLSSAHSPDEYLEVGAVVPAALVYALTAIEFCR
jgi:acetylornithine deacetylase/succinyl-diaminopimelate desuccinylase